MIARVKLSSFIVQLKLKQVDSKSSDFGIFLNLNVRHLSDKVLKKAADNCKKVIR